MSQYENELIVKMLKTPGEAMELIGRLFDIAKPNRIFSEPVEVGDYTVITASEMLITMGAGYGGGWINEPNDEAEEIAVSPGYEAGGGGGGGGGGYSMGRPVASITVGPEGVRVDPIIDPTKISIAFFTTFAAIIMTLSQVWRIRNK